MKELNRFIDKIIGIAAAIIFLPILLALAILVVPIILISIYINGIIEKTRLQKEITLNNGAIFFLYSDYNNYDFSEYFKENYKHIICFKVKNYHNNGLIGYLTKECNSQCYPKLVKIQDRNLIIKYHYTAFKSFYKKKNDIEGFYALIERSIKNLENENTNTR